MSTIADDLRERTFRYSLRTIAFCRSLPADSVGREIGRQLLRAGMGVSGNYWSACRGRSDKEFIARLGVAADEAEQSVLWLMAIIQSGVRADPEGKELLREGQELRAILARSHKTARENRRKRKRSKSPTHQIANSPSSTAGSP